VAGSTAAVLGRLAAVAGDLPAARRHLQHALRVELALPAPAYAARTRGLLAALEAGPLVGTSS
jgi:hypothetical protein